MNGHNTIQIACRRCKHDEVPDAYVKAMEEVDVKENKGNVQGSGHSSEPKQDKETGSYSKLGGGMDIVTPF